MDRRSDRTVGLVTIIAVAVIPAALLATGKITGAFDGGDATTVQISPDREDYPGAPKLIAAAPPPKPPITVPGLPRPGKQPPKPPVKPAESVPALPNYFERQIGLVSFQITGTEQIQSHTKFWMRPAFRSDTLTTRYMMGPNQKWKKVSVTHVVVKGKRRATSVGRAKPTIETLTTQQLTELRQQADPRAITRKVKVFPGVKHVVDKKTKLITYTVKGTAGLLVLQLPKEIRDQVPAIALISSLGMDMYDVADKQDRTFVFGLSGIGLGGAGLGVIYSNFK
ncbi:MAG: hypothetical protein ABIS86_00795 [Streptosporangiaceae bacterium]